MPPTPDPSTMEHFVETLMVTAGAMTAAGAIGSGVLWMLREKIADWVKGRVKDLLEEGVMDQRITDRTSDLRDAQVDMEERMTEAEKTGALIAQSLDTMSRGFERLTQTLQRVDDRSEDTAKTVARIEGSIERRSAARPRGDER